jgi:hypothetical protein
MMVLWLVFYFMALACCCALVGASRVMQPERARPEQRDQHTLDRPVALVLPPDSSPGELSPRHFVATPQPRTSATIRS